ncbi:hypothetical protein ACO0LG_08700 [Undibacterium sp. Ji42W]|uniref:phage adaptor protein n=1 Tax=Undibacterium sp. Ji42W TaxID=3413039 RepID=UPI003BF266A1
MATTPFTSFLNEVLPYVHDCPQFVAVNAIRNAAIEFCDRSGYWQLDVPDVAEVDGQATYQVTVPAGTRVVDIHTAWFNEILIIPHSIEELNRLFRGVHWRNLVGQPKFLYSSPDGFVHLVPAPTVSGVVRVRVTLAPTRTSTGIDSDIYEKQAEVIAHGARARLLGTAGQPFYDPVQSVSQRTAFLSGCNDAKIRANKATSRASVQVEIPRFI